MKRKYLTFLKGLIIIVLSVVSGFFILMLNRRQALGRELILIPLMQGKPSFYIGEDGMKLCECGCGREVTKEGNRFIHGHNARGKHHTEEAKKKLSEANKGKYEGKNNPFYGINHKGENNPMYGVHRIGKDAPMYGHKHTKKTKKRQSEANKDKKKPPFTKEHLKNMSEGKKGNKNALGCNHTEKTRKKMSIARILYMQNNKGKFKDTSIELKIEDELKKSGLNYQKQFHIKRVGIVDFFLPDYRIIIECDGDYWHNLSGAQQKDSNRDFMATFGDRYEVVRFWEHEINKSSEKCMKRLFKAIKKRKRK